MIAPYRETTVAAGGPDEPFPARVLNRTEVIDVDRAEFLLSLA